MPRREMVLAPVMSELPKAQQESLGFVLSGASGGGFYREDGAFIHDHSTAIYAWAPDAVGVDLLVCFGGTYEGREQKSVMVRISRSGKVTDA